MDLEVEVKFLDTDHDMVRKSLKEMGGVCTQPMRTMRRIVFDFPDGRLEKSKSRLRIRDEGHKITMTFKSQDPQHDYQNETEIVVDSFDNAQAILESLGLNGYSYQETQREAWDIDDCEVVLDVWPWVKPYIEVEGPSEESIKKVAEKMGFMWSDRKYGSVETVYRHEYVKMKDDEILKFPKVTFDEPVPQWLKDRR